VIKLIRDNNARVWINALGEPDAHIRQGMAATAIDTLLMYGANIIQTDEPELLLEALKARKLHP
jgi:glycerophosphoryl diester phosphodiesterase